VDKKAKPEAAEQHRGLFSAERNAWIVGRLDVLAGQMVPVDPHDPAAGWRAYDAARVGEAAGEAPDYLLRVHRANRSPKLWLWMRRDGDVVVDRVLLSPTGKLALAGRPRIVRRESRRAPSHVPAWARLRSASAR
jgi:hypothetical protein